jgi:hypothetical protein
MYCLTLSLLTQHDCSTISNPGHSPAASPKYKHKQAANEGCAPDDLSVLQLQLLLLVVDALLLQHLLTGPSCTKRIALPRRLLLLPLATAAAACIRVRRCGLCCVCCCCLL